MCGGRLHANELSHYQRISEASPSLCLVVFVLRVARCPDSFENHAHVSSPQVSRHTRHLHERNLRQVDAVQSGAKLVTSSGIVAHRINTFSSGAPSPYSNPAQPPRNPANQQPWSSIIFLHCLARTHSDWIAVLCRLRVAAAMAAVRVSDEYGKCVEQGRAQRMP